jgi:hypothetical protein
MYPVDFNIILAGRGGRSAELGFMVELATANCVEIVARVGSLER